MPAVTVTSAPPLLVTSEVSGLTGLLCEIGLISSVALGDNSTLEFSFALPHVRPQYDAVLACFTAPGMALQPGGVSVASATEYHNGARRPISADLMPEVDTLTIPDALANDPDIAFLAALHAFVLLTFFSLPSDPEGCLVSLSTRASILMGTWYLPGLLGPGPSVLRK